MITRTFGVLIVVLATCLSRDVARADLIIEFENARMQAGQTGSIDVFIRSTDGSDLVAQYNVLFAVEHVSGPGIMEFQPTPQDNSEIFATNYIFANDSNDFQATRDNSFRNRMTQSDFASGNVLIGSSLAARRLLGRLELNHTAPSDQIATFPGAEYRVSVIRSNELTFFQTDDFSTNVAIDDRSYSNFGTITVLAVPEPSVIGLLAAAVAGVAFRRRTKN